MVYYNSESDDKQQHRVYVSKINCPSCGKELVLVLLDCGMPCECEECEHFERLECDGMIEACILLDGETYEVCPYCGADVYGMDGE